MKKNKVLKTKVYRLNREAAPLSYILPSKDSARQPLLHFDGESNRPLRYAKNQKSPYRDEQDGNAVLEPIIFEDGFLTVGADNPVLQRFLEIHPGNGMVYKEVDHEKNAQDDLEKINSEVDALILAKEMDISSMENIGRVLLGLKVNGMTSAELKRDILIYAKTYPSDFLDAVNDPMIKTHSMVAKCFDQNIISLRNKGRDVYFNLKSNKTKMLTVPFGEEPMYTVSSYLVSDDGIETYKLLEKNLD